MQAARNGQSLLSPQCTILSSVVLNLMGSQRVDVVPCRASSSASSSFPSSCLASSSASPSTPSSVYTNRSRTTHHLILPPPYTVSIPTAPSACTGPSLRDQSVAACMSCTSQVDAMVHLVCLAPASASASASACQRALWIEQETRRRQESHQVIGPIVHSTQPRANPVADVLHNGSSFTLPPPYHTFLHLHIFKPGQGLRYLQGTNLYQSAFCTRPPTPTK